LRRMLTRRAVYLVLLWVYPTSTYSQVTNGVIAGKVLSDRGAILANASVSITNSEIGLQRLFKTDEGGRYRASLLPLGTYQIGAAHPGFNAAQRDLVLGMAETRSVDLVLGSGPRPEPARAPGVAAPEASRTQPGTSINSKLIESLPVSGRKFLDLGVMVVGATEFGDRDSSATADFAGVNHFYSNMLVDGTDAFQAWSNFPRGKFLVPFEFSQDAVREIQVLNSNFSAEFGRSAGGIVNVITRSGTNAWRGDAFYYFSDSAMQATPRFSVVKPDARLNQFGGSVGGPIVKHRLFFFVNYDQQVRDDPLIVTPGTVLDNYEGTLSSITDPVERQRFVQAGDFVRSQTGDSQRELDQISFLVRTDWVPAAGQTVTARVNYQDFRATNVPENGFAVPTAAGFTLSNQGRATVKNFSLVAQWSALLTSRVTNEARFQLAVTRETETANAPGPQVRIGSRNSGFSFGGGEVFPRTLNEDRWQWADTVSYQSGRHVFKAGLDIHRLDDSVLSLPFGKGAYQFSTLRDFANSRYQMYTQAIGLPEDRVVSPYYSFFAQDDIQLRSNLTLNLGLRYEFQDLAQPLLSNPEFPQTGSIMNDGNNVAPRAGLAWSPAERMVVRAGYGIYYAPIPLQVNSVARTDNGVFRALQELRLGGPGAPVYPAVFPADAAPQRPARGSDIIVFSPAYATPYIQQGSLEVEGQILPELTLTSGWLISKGTRLRRNENINLLPPSPATVQVRDTASNFAETAVISSFQGAPRPYPFFDRVTEFKFDSNSIYHAFYIQASARPRRGLQFLANYTLSKLLDYEQAPGNQINCCTSENPFNHQGERGLGRRDQRHRFNLMGTWDTVYSGKNNFLRHFGHGWQLSTIVRAGSGRPYSATVSGDAGGDLNGDGVPGDRAPTFGRGAFTGPGYASVDTGVHRTFSVGEQRRVSLGLEAFNLFNRANYLRPSTEYFTMTNLPGGMKLLQGPLPSFGTPLDATRSRQLQVVLRLYL
jgi:hypothetical protein